MNVANYVAEILDCMNNTKGNEALAEIDIRAILRKLAREIEDNLDVRLDDKYHEGYEDGYEEGCEDTPQTI